jgi:hypothetical protein
MLKLLVESSVVMKKIGLKFRTFSKRYLTTILGVEMPRMGNIPENWQLPD